jgi:hypothetical protein
LLARATERHAKAQRAGAKRARARSKTRAQALKSSPEPAAGRAARPRAAGKRSRRL